MTLAPPANAFARLPASHRRGRGGLPAVIVGAGAVVVFLWCGVSARDLAAFAAYIGIGVALPGTLLWRALAGGGRSRAEDVAAGLAFGYALEVLAYLPARALGAPLLVLVMPAGVLGAFAFVPRLRRHWRGGLGQGGLGLHRRRQGGPELRRHGRGDPGQRRRWRGGPAAVRSAGRHAIGGTVAERMPAWCAWALAAVVAYLIAWSALHLYRVPISRSYVDMPYHLALVGEVRHHVPPTLPSVLGEPLSYHWFVHAEMAATSWVTGIEPVTLVYRLSTLPMMAAMVVLVAVVGRQLGGRWGAGVAAVGVTYFLLSPALREGADFTSRSMFTAWASPTQTFGALLFAPVVLLLTRGRLGRGWVGRLGRGWVALVVLLVALTGAKATFLPLLLAGAVVVVAVRWVVERRLRADWLGVAGVALVCLVIAQVVVFGRGSQGTVVAPFATMRVLWGAVAGVGEPELAAVPVAPLAVLTCVHLFCLACVWGGVAALGRRVLEPSMSLLLGMGAAGVGAAVLLGHPASSQLYFLESVRPYLSVAAVCGVAGRRVPWRSPAAMAGAGAVIALLAARVEVPGGVLAGVVTPYALLGASAVAALLLWRRAGRTTRAAPVGCGRAGGTTRAGPVGWGRAGGAVQAGPVVSWRGRAGVAVVAMVAGFAVPASVREAALRVAPEHGGRLVEIPPGAVRAARWLRGHSVPGDVVATDLHCRPVRMPGCDSRHYWVAGLTERRVLVEGWAYAESTLSRAELFVSPYLRVPFADQARLAANDAAFRAPSARNVQHLAQKYGVKWLFTGINPELGKFAQLRFRNSHFSVYRIG